MAAVILQVRPETKRPKVNYWVTHNKYIYSQYQFKIIIIDLFITFVFYYLYLYVLLLNLTYFDNITARQSYPITLLLITL